MAVRAGKQKTAISAELIGDKTMSKRKNEVKIDRYVLWKNIDRLQAVNEINDHDLCEKIGVCDSWMCACRKRKCIPSLDIANSIAKAFHVSIEELIKNMEE